MDVKPVKNENVNGVNDNRASTKVKNAKKAQNVSLIDTLAPAAEETHDGSTEKVQLSDRAQFMREATEIAQNSPDVRADKVKALKEKIKGGHYKVDSHKVAEAMIKDSVDEALASKSSQ